MKALNRISPSNELLLYGEIGAWADSLDADSVLSQLEALDSDEIAVRIHSSGGLVMEGLAIYNRLKNSPKRVTVYIDGLAASIASVIAMAGDHVVMPENSWLMVHKPHLQTAGTANDLRKNADVLDSFEQTLIQIYKVKTGLPEEIIKEMLEKETWISAKDALEKGFVDEIQQPIKAAAHIDLSALKSVPKEVSQMTDAALAENKAELERVNAIQSLALKHKIPASMATNLIDQAVPLSEAKSQILEYLAEKDAKGMVGRGAIVESNDGGPDARLEAFSEVMAARNGIGRASDFASQYMHLSAVDMARAMLEAKGISTRSMAPSAIAAKAMHSTSDFPVLLQQTGDRVMRMAYETASAPFRAVAKKRLATDFRPLTSVQLSEAPSLDLVKEGGEYKYGSMTESQESYSLQTFGKIFQITRQAVVNDDLGAFVETASRFGQAAAERENAELSKLVTSNVKLSDNKALFHADHSNLGSAGVISTTTLTEARKMMRKQKGLDGKTPIDARPKYLIVPAAMETTAEQLLAAIYSTTVAEVNPFSGMLELLVDPRLDAISETAWYLFADPAVLPCLEYAHLEAEQGLFTEIENGFDTDSVRIKARLDFGAGVLDFRGAFKNAGA